VDLNLSAISAQVGGLFDQSITYKKLFVEKSCDQIAQVVELMVKAFESGNKILFFGNGGSAADAQHMAAEFVNRMLIERPPMPAIALSTDTSTLTSIANDYSFDEVFSKQIRALGKYRDVAFGLTTSGNSPNVNRALEEANQMGLVTVVLSGKDGGEAAKIAKHSLVVGDGANTPRIQEVHITVGHIIVELIDDILFGSPK